MKDKKPKHAKREWLVPLVSAIALLALTMTPLLKNLDLGISDIYLLLCPSIEQDENIVLLDIDDLAIEQLGGWPWPRTYMAQGLQLLAEFGAGAVVLDIEYNTPSPPGVNRPYLEKTLRRDFDTQFGDLSSYIASLYSALVAEQIPLADADSYVNDLLFATNETKDSLYKSSEAVAIDSDELLAQSIGFNALTGTAYRFLTQKNENLTLDERKKTMSLLQVSAEGIAKNQDRYIDFLPTLLPMTEKGAWAGYVNIEIDPDGKRRRIKPIETLNGANYGQLVFEALLSWLGNPDVSITKNSILLKDAQYPDGIKDIKIPLDSDGNMLVHWPTTQYPESFRHLSFYYLIRYQEQVQELVDNVSGLARRDAWGLMGENPAAELVAYKSAIDALLSNALVSGSQDDKEMYFAQKEEWFSAVNNFLETGYDAAFDTGILEYASTLNDEDEQKTLWLDERRAVLQLFSNIKTSYSTVTENQALLHKQLNGSFCIIGYTGTGTSDLGATPFQKDYPNTGTHACVVNTILQNNFLQTIPVWISYLLIILLPFLLFLLIRGRNPVAQNIFGFTFIACSIVLPFAVYIAFGIYTMPIAAVFAVIATFIGNVVMRFLGEAHEKSFLRKAFGVYIADEVIDELVENPDKLTLGGENRVMTAMFTDIEKFSTISEQLTATELVHLLNEYLTGMSDIILDEKGVVDKYEGDAIIAFWGAPVEQPNHAEYALVSAIKMKKKEDELNKYFLEEKMTPMALRTRIGINTGDMVAGNMGTDRKMNYTIMGNTVNLAARLEGVNKMYGTWILTTDFTAEKNMDRFVFRRLDRVRVVGIKTPVQLRELIDEKSEISQEKLSFLAGFDRALGLFEARSWEKAGRGFKELLTIDPEDGPSNLYFKRCSEYLKTPPKNDWDGVFNMTQK